MRIVNQKNYNYSAPSTLDSLHIPKPDFNTIDLQVRFFIFNNASGVHKLFFINRLKDGTWRGWSIEYYNYSEEHYDFKNTLTDTIALQESWTRAFEELVYKGYINLPSQKEVQKRITQSEKNTPVSPVMVIADGKSYSVAFITKKAKRNFSFSNPEEYYKHYLSQGEAASYFQKYVDLLNILRSSLDFDTHLPKSQSSG